MRGTDATVDLFRALPAASSRFARTAGRSSAADEHAKSSVTLISEKLWRRKFAADPGVIGRTVRFETEPFTVIGVVLHPPGRFPEWADVWLPFSWMDSEMFPYSQVSSAGSDRAPEARSQRRAGTEGNACAGSAAGGRTPRDERHGGRFRRSARPPDHRRRAPGAAAGMGGRGSGANDGVRQSGSHAAGIACSTGGRSMADPGGARRGARAAHAYCIHGKPGLSADRRGRRRCPGSGRERGSAARNCKYRAGFRAAWKRWASAATAPMFVLVSSIVCGVLFALPASCAQCATSTSRAGRRSSDR